MTQIPNVSADQPDTARTTPGGPHPGILASVSLAILVASLVVTTLMSNGQTYVSPFSSTKDVVAYFRDNSEAVRLGAMLQVGSAVPFGIFAATVYARLTRLGVRVPGPRIAFFGGITAAILLIVSGMVTWVLSQPEVTMNGPLTHALSFLAFSLGGFGYVLGSGLLVAGIAVPSLILGLLPRPLAWAGLVIALLSELSFLAMVIEPLQVLLPIGRFAGLLWLIAAGFLLPHQRHTARQVTS